MIRFISLLLIVFNAYAGDPPPKNPNDKDQPSHPKDDLSKKQDIPPTLAEKSALVELILNENFFGQNLAKSDLVELFKLESMPNLTAKPRSVLSFGGDGAGKSFLLKVYAMATTRKSVRVSAVKANEISLETFWKLFTEEEQRVLIFEDIEHLNTEKMSALTSVVSGKSNLVISNGVLVGMTTQKGAATLADYVMKASSSKTPEPIKPVGYGNATQKVRLEEYEKLLLRQGKEPKQIQISREGSLHVLETEGLPSLLLSNTTQVSPFLPPTHAEAEFAAHFYINRALKVFQSRHNVTPVLIPVAADRYVKTLLRDFYFGMTHAQIRERVEIALQKNLAESVGSKKLDPNSKLFILFNAETGMKTYCSSRLKGERGPTDNAPDVTSPNRSE